MTDPTPIAWDSAPRPGVFSSEMLRDAVAQGLIAAPKSDPVADSQYQPASLDLRLGSTAVIAIDPHPMHFPTLRDLFFANNGNIILTLTRNDTGRTTHATIQINRHTPLMNITLESLTNVVGMLVNWQWLALTVVRNMTAVSLQIHVLREIWLLVELLKIRFTNDSSTLH